MLLTRLAAAATLFMMGLQLARFDTLSEVPCAPTGVAEMLFVPLLFLAPPYLMVLVLFRRRSAGLAVVLGVLGGVLTVAAIIIAIVKPTGLLTYWDLLGWSVFAGVQYILVTTGARAARAIVGPEHYRALLFSSVRIIGLYFFVLWLAYALWPPVLAQSRTISEATAINTMRLINAGQQTYHRRHPERGYAATFEELEAAKTITPGTTNDLKWYGYVMVMAAGRPDASGSITGYEAWATLDQQPRGFCRNFFTNESRTIRFTREDRRANAADPPLY